MGINVWEAIDLANFHPRVNIHKPGPGVGGHCIAVDPWFLYDSSPDLAKIIELSRHTNDSMPKYTVESVESIFRNEAISNPKVAVFGLAFKGNIDDMRESPSLDIIHHLEEKGIDYVAYDPHIKENQLTHQTQNIEEAVSGADLLLVLTDHDYFKTLQANDLKDKMRCPIIYDTKNCIDTKSWKQAGFTTYTLGSINK
jgi:UDP-N-acetyl-D-mannosaminuronic acid dehydrogenase